MIEFDLKRLMVLRHRCVGCVDATACCCAQFEVCVTAKEMQRMLDFLPQASRYCQHLKSGAGYENVFDQIGSNLYTVDTDEHGLCVFAYRHAEGIRCSLHTVALDLDIPLKNLKPISCRLWPLSISSGRDKLVSVLDDVYAFPCNTKRHGARKRLDEGVAELIEGVWGSKVRTRVENREKATRL